MFCLLMRMDVYRDDQGFIYILDHQSLIGLKETENEQYPYDKKEKKKKAEPSNESH